MSASIVWAAALVIAFMVVMSVALNAATKPPTSYVVKPVPGACPTPTTPPQPLGR